MRGFSSLFQVFLSLIALFKELSNVPSNDAGSLEIQAPAINALVNAGYAVDKGAATRVAEPAPDTQVPYLAEGRARPLVRSSQTQSAVPNTETTEVNDTSAYSEHFKYISTMVSIGDSYFRRTIRKDLMKNQQVTWKAFDSLSPESV